MDSLSYSGDGGVSLLIVGSPHGHLDPCQDERLASSQVGVNFNDMGLTGKRFGRHIESETIPILLTSCGITGNSIDSNVYGAALTVNEADDDLDLAIGRFRPGLQAENAI